MLKKEDVMVIQALVRRGVYQCDIARQLGVHPKTVRRAMARGGAPGPRPGRRSSRLDPYRAEVDRLLQEGVWNAVVIFRELQAKGYTGQLSILREYIRPKRVLRASRATVRFETKPGQQLQSDWAVTRTEIAGRQTDVSFIVNTLGFSRRFHFWGTDSADAEHTYEGLIRAFEWFAGVPSEVLVDNQKCAVLEHPRGGPVQFHRMVAYIKHHFFVRYRTVESWAHLNQLAEQWLHAEADQTPARHGLPNVAERFTQEASTLQPLPARRYDTSYWELRHVSWDAYIEVRGNRYSVLASRRVPIVRASVRIQRTDQAPSPQ